MRFKISKGIFLFGLLFLQLVACQNQDFTVNSTGSISRQTRASKANLIPSSAQQAEPKAILAERACLPDDLVHQGSAGLDSPEYPLWGNGGYDVQHMALDVEVDVSDNFIWGEAQIEATATQQLSSFNLDLIGLAVDDVMLNGRFVNHCHDGKEITILPEMPLAPNESFVLTLHYSGFPQISETQHLASRGGWMNDGQSIVMLPTLPGMAAVWYPNNDHPEDKATYTIKMTTTAPFTALFNGTLQDQQTKSGKTTSIWTMDTPMNGVTFNINQVGGE